MSRKGQHGFVVGALPPASPFPGYGTALEHCMSDNEVLYFYIVNLTSASAEQALCASSVAPLTPSFAPGYSASQERLLPKAFILTGDKFMSALAIFDILSKGNPKERSLQRIPSGSKSNCYFHLYLGKDLTEYKTASDNRLKV